MSLQWGRGRVTAESAKRQTARRDTPRFNGAAVV